MDVQLCHQMKEFQGLLWSTQFLFCLSTWASFLCICLTYGCCFFLERQEQVTGTSYSSILLQTHRNPWGSSALVFEYFLLYFFIVIILIKLFVDRRNKNNMWLRPQAVLRVLCVFWGVDFFILLLLLCGWNNLKESSSGKSLSSVNVFWLLWSLQECFLSFFFSWPRSRGLHEI